MVGHTHEKVDGWHVHLRAFMLGLLKCMTGAVVALPAQLLKAMSWTGPSTATEGYELDRPQHHLE